MKTIYSPNNIDVLLHCHTCPRPHERFNAPAVQDAIRDLLNAGAIEPDGDERFSTTPLGRAWVQALCSVPPPRTAFIDEQGRVIEP
jgi:hypothetical protein